MRWRKDEAGVGNVLTILVDFAVQHAPFNFAVGYSCSDVGVILNINEGRAKRESSRRNVVASVSGHVHRIRVIQ